MQNSYNDSLAQQKIEFIEKIVSESSLDTLREWYSMYDEARYVASMNSNEEELKAYNKDFNDRIKRGLGQFEP